MKADIAEVVICISEDPEGQQPDVEDWDTFDVLMK